MTLFLSLVYEFIISSVCAFSFGLFFNSPKRSLIPSAFTSGLGWILYYYLKSLNLSYIFPVFFATLTVGILAEIFARIVKTPVTIVLIPCIIPLVPGGSIYYMMFYIIQNNKNLIAFYSSQTLLSACAIAVGIIMSSSIFRAYKSIKHFK